MKARIILTLLFFLFAIISISQPKGAVALATLDEAAIVGFTQQDINGDNEPDLAFIRAEYIGENFLVRVYDQGNDMKWNESWQAGTDFMNDIWLFQLENSNQVKLIIQFTSSPEGYTANLYDDVDGDGEVNYRETNNGVPEITESEYPSVKVLAQKPWVLLDGSSNPIVHVFIYKPITSYTISSPEIAQFLPKDGRPAYEDEIVDSNSDGIPEYELIQSFPDLPYGWNTLSNSIMVNVDRKIPAGYKGAFVWPYLGNASSGGSSSNSDNAPIRIDWRNAQIKSVGGFMNIGGLRAPWYFLTSKPIKKNEINELDWERFGAYYFSGSDTNDLITRLIQGVPGDPEVINVGSKLLHRQNFAISWHHRNLGTLEWDFKLEMAGLHESPDTVVKFKDFSLREVPYEEAIYYYNSLNWAYATFVAAEENLYGTSEGMYEWETQGGVLNDSAEIYSNKRIPGSAQSSTDYLMGKSDISPAIYYEDIRQGFRGEYADLLESKAWLYFSPIDHKLHLLKASRGIWNLDGNREIHYENLGGETLNKWSLWQEGKAQKSFYSVAGYNILDENGQLKFMKTVISPILFLTQPPTNKDEWTQLGKQLEKYKPDFAPDDFTAMFDQFTETSISINAAAVRDFRLTTDGFRFVLVLQPDFAVDGPDWLGIQNLQAGEYLIMFSEGFQIEPITPPQLMLEISTHTAKLSTEGSLYQVSLKARNTGNQDSNNLFVNLQAECGDNIQEILHSPTKVISEDEVNWEEVWLPPPGEDCYLYAALADESGNQMAQTSLKYTSPTSLTAKSIQLLDISTQEFRTVPTVLLLALIAGLLGRAFWLTRRPVRDR